jgi:zinc protease
MTLSRIRFLLTGVLATALFVVGQPAISQTPAARPAQGAAAPAAQAPTGRETTAESVASYGLNQSLPIDPEATLGTLPNGVKYYIRPNPKPAHRVEMRLVVKAGSVLEDADQQGLAHFVEHMLFEGTRNFPRQGVIQFLGALGLGIGPDANAVTSFDDTQYTLRLPTDAPDVLDRGLLVLEDWAHAATFDEAAIERERGIVLSEWRQHLGATERTFDKVRGVQLEGSRYASRPPIGDPDVIQKATREQLVRFYRDWYRPNLMAVIVVGDIDRGEVVRMVKAHFTTLTNPTPQRVRPSFDVPERPGTRYTIVTDKEATATSVSLSNLRPSRRQDTVGGYRQIMMDQMFGDMLDARLDELAQMENPPFLRVTAERALFPTPRTKDEAVLEALVPNDGAARGLETLITELQRVTRFGFTATELARAKQAMMLSYERSVTESPDRESASRADEYTRNFLQSEALPTIWQELAFHRRFIPGITLAEINALAAQWFPEQNRLVIVTAPEGTGVKLPTQAELSAAVRRGAAKTVTRYVDIDAGQALMDAKPMPGTIVKTVARPEAGVTEWTLSNGARVVLKPTTFKEDQILFRATAPGGSSLASDADSAAARVADDVVAAGGVGRFNAPTVDKILSGKAVVVSPFIGELNQGMVGGSTPQDLDAMFQLLHLRFTQPRADAGAFAAFVSQAKGLLANQQASPDIVFDQAVDAALSKNHIRRQPLTQATVDHLDLQKSLAFYKARFADASAFTFVFVGSFTPEMLKPFVETYVASLPATHAGETWKDPGVTLPTGIVDKKIEKGIAPKSEVAIVFSGPFVYDDAHVLALRAMTMVLESRLFDSIRQELGGTYSIGADPAMQKYPQPQYTVRIDWTSDPARTNALVQRVFEEIRYVRDLSFSRDQVSRIRAAMQREFEQNAQNNGYLLNQISARYENGDGSDVGAVMSLPDRIQQLTGAEIHEAAVKYLDLDNYVKVTLMPEGKEPIRTQ